MKINYNGKLVKSNSPILTASNRGIKYGDGLFETIRIFNGKIVFWKQHWLRLKAGAKYLQFQNLKTEKVYKSEIKKLCGVQGNWRVRLSVFREDGGFYMPESNKTNFLIEATSLEDHLFKLNKKGLNIGVCDSVFVPRNVISNFKTINSLIYVLAAIYNQKHQVDDSILLNEKGHLVEAASSNLFLLKGNKLQTPKPSSGCKLGTMRAIIFGNAPALKLSISEKKLTIRDLKSADEIWLTNAIQGIKWVQSFKGKTYKNQKAHQMIYLLNKLLLK